MYRLAYASPLAHCIDCGALKPPAADCLRCAVNRACDILTGVTPRDETKQLAVTYRPLHGGRPS